MSAVQQGMIAELVRKAARDGSYHVRAAAALAMGLMGDEGNVRDLEKLARDPAYVAYPDGATARRVLFPVRSQAAASLARFGKTATVPEGTYSGKELKQVLRGGRDVTRDRSGMDPKLTSGVYFAESDW